MKDFILSINNESIPIVKFFSFIKDQKQYIASLEHFIKQNYHQENSPQNSFLQIKSESKTKAKSDPVLKSMVFGFPHPRETSLSSSSGSDSNIK
jgi:hypothetical protein